MSVYLSHDHFEGRTTSRTSCHVVISAPYPPVQAPSEAHQSFQDQVKACEAGLKGDCFVLFFFLSPYSSSRQDQLIRWMACSAIQPSQTAESAIRGCRVRVHQGRIVMSAAITVGLQLQFQCSLFSERQADNSPNRNVASCLGKGRSDELTSNKMSWLISS